VSPSRTDVEAWDAALAGDGAAFAAVTTSVVDAGEVPRS
jgi:hypothetical protein